MLPIILPIAFCIMLLIFLLAGCDSIIEYIVYSLFSMFGSHSQYAYSSLNVQTPKPMISDNFSSEDGLC